VDPRIVGIATAFGLASSAGLNTTLPLLIVAALARTGDIHLTAPYNHALTTNTFIGFLALVALVEFIGDKVPGLDSIVHVLQFPVAAASGAVLFASQHSSIYTFSPELALGIGLVIAATIHGGRATVRPVITGTTLGFGNPVISTVEDVLAVLLAWLSIAAPLVGFILALVLLVALVLVGRWAFKRGAAAFGRRRQRGAAARP
jgi:hypothetical protein